MDAEARDKIESAQSHFQEVEIRFISESPTNPRKNFNQALQDQLTDSIKVHGVISPVLLRPLAGKRFELVAGARRFRSASAAGLFRIPAMVRAMSDSQVLELQVIENLQREDLHELEEAEGYERLMREFGYTIDTLVTKINKSRSYIYARLKLCALNAESRKAFYAGDLSASVALMLARIPDAALQSKALGEVLHSDWSDREPMSAREAADHLQRNYMLRLASAPFPTDHQDLVPGTGPCTTCPKRTGNDPELFADISGPDVCSDPGCFAEKREAFKLIRIAEVEAKGQSVISGAEAKKLKPRQYDNRIAGFVRLDEVPYDLASSTKPPLKKMEKILGKDRAAVQIFEDPHNGDLIEVIKTADAKAALERRGYKLNSSKSSSADDAKKEKLKLKIDAAWRKALFDAIRPALSEQKLFDLHVVAGAMFARLFNEDQKKIRTIFNWGTDSPDAAIAKMTGEQAYELLVSMAIINELSVNFYSSSKPERMLALATALQIDAEAMRRQIAADLKPAVKKPAAQKSASKKPEKKKTNETTPEPGAKKKRGRPAKAKPAPAGNDATALAD